MSEYFSGRVHRVVYDNPPFFVMHMVLDESEADDGDEGWFTTHSNVRVTVRGNVPGMAVQEGTWFGFDGKWVTHEKYGKQLSIIRAPVIKGGWTADVIHKLLVTNGVGELVMDRLVKQFGEDLQETLDAQDPNALLPVRGMTPLTAEFVIDRWIRVKAYFGTLGFLADVGVPHNRISQVWSMFEDKAKEVLTNNPWALVRVDGITFGQADEVALRLGLTLDNPLRVQGAVLHTCKTKKGMGHLYLGSGGMLSEVQRHIPDAGASDVAGALAVLHKAGSIVVDRKTRPGTTAIYEPWLYQMESECAQLLHERMGAAVIDEDEYRQRFAKVGPGAEEAAEDDQVELEQVAEAALRDWGLGSRIVLSEAQLQGALNALVEPVSILSGLPGTGKTTSLRAVVQVLVDAGLNLLLVAPTGIAAKRINMVTGSEASTIHRALGAKGWDVGGERTSTYVGVVGDSSSGTGSDGSGERWGYSPQKPHPADVVVVDESSMVDQHILYRVLSCTKPTTRVVFVGDAAQLPSVGPGNVLRDLIESNLFPTVNLTEIYRQEDTSDIVIAAHAVHNGEVPEVGTKGSDFVLLSSEPEDGILGIVLRLAAKLYDKRVQFQVMSPRHAGTLGVTNLNAKLRDLLNPKKTGLAEMRLGSEIVREGDRVMVVKNNYKLGIYNGDMGKIAQLDRKAKEVVVKIHGAPPQYVRIGFGSAPRHIRLAYAVTVHKMQGQESEVVVLPLITAFGHQLQRNLFYTAITRAKKRVLLVGHHKAMGMAVRNNRPDARNTLFLDRLQAIFSEQGGSKSASTA
jgi:exodeoxyribonuclease V alpha subunit